MHARTHTTPCGKKNYTDDVCSMGRKLGPEKAYFGGDDGLVTEVTGGATRYFWRCMFCGFEIGGKCFPNQKARVHLSGDSSLKTGLISTLCTNAPEDIKVQFTVLEKAKRAERANQLATRKRGAELMKSSPTLPSGKRKRVQAKLQFPSTQRVSDAHVDDAWGRAFFGLDIPGNKLSDPLFKEAITATRNAKPGYVAYYHSCLGTIYELDLLQLLLCWSDIKF